MPKLWGKFKNRLKISRNIRDILIFNHCNCVITKCAETGLVPPASGVMVNAVEFPAGFRTVKTEFITVVVTKAIPTICDAHFSSNNSVIQISTVKREQQLTSFCYTNIKHNLICPNSKVIIKLKKYLI